MMPKPNYEDGIMFMADIGHIKTYICKMLLIQTKLLLLLWSHTIGFSE